MIVTYTVVPSNPAKNLEYIVTGDWHVDWNVHSPMDNVLGIPERTKDIFQSLDRIIHFCLPTSASAWPKPQLFLFCGDFFKSRTPSNKIREMLSERIKKLADLGICFIAALGNHDVSTHSDSLSQIYPFIQGSDKICIPKNTANVRVAGTDLLVHVVPWGCEPSPPDQPHITIAHDHIAGAKLSASEFEVKEGGNLLKYVNGHTKYVYFGHIHKPQRLSSLAEYVGSLERLDFGEAEDAKRYIMGKWDGKDVTNMDVPVPNRSLITISFDKTIDGDSEFAIDPTAVEFAIVKVKIKAYDYQRKSLQLSKLYDQLSKAIYVCPIEFEVVQPADSSSAYENDPLAALNSYMEKFQPPVPSQQVISKMVELIKEAGQEGLS